LSFVYETIYIRQQLTKRGKVLNKIKFIRFKGSRSLLLPVAGAVLLLSVIIFPFIQNPASHIAPNKKVADIVTQQSTNNTQPVSQSNTSQTNNNPVSTDGSSSQTNNPSSSSSISVTTNTTTTGNQPADDQCATNVVVNGKSEPSKSGCNVDQNINSSTGNMDVNVSSNNDSSSYNSSNQSNSDNSTYLQFSSNDSNSASSDTSSGGTSP
jgi:hypothetical protein